MMVNNRRNDDMQQPPLMPDPGDTAIKYVKAVCGVFAIAIAIIAVIGHFDWVEANGLWIMLAGILVFVVLWQWPRILHHREDVRDQSAKRKRENDLNEAQVAHLNAKTTVLQRTIAFDERGNAGLLHEGRVVQLGGNYTELPASIQNLHNHHHVVNHSAALPAKTEPEAVVDADVPIPQAPSFRTMNHLISEQRMPLCYIIENGASVPAFGTIDDLLSMAVTGKPGRGKTTALMYYVCMLLKCGAEVYVFDPHGSMADLAALNNMPLPGMPKTSRILYVDRREDMVNLVPVLMGKLDERDEKYRRCQREQRKYENHPMLLLADELPVLRDYDMQTVSEYKIINKRRLQTGQIALDVPLMSELIRHFVLDARKWRCFFIGSGQTFDAEVLPTRITDSLNSRIVFFSSDQRARMSGLENDIVKSLLPVIRNAGPGVMVFDCSRWEPMIGAIPAITPEDMRTFLGVTSRSSLPDLPMRQSIASPEQTEPLDPSLGQNAEDFSEEPRLRLVEPVRAVRDQSSEGETRTRPGPVTGQLRANKDARFTTEQSKTFAQEYRKDMLINGNERVDIKAILRRMKLGNGYYRHASIIAEHIRRQTTM